MQRSTDGWIDSNLRKPPLVEGQDYSEKVWGWDANQNATLVVEFYHDSDGWHWANAYGNVWGDAFFDDDYNITHWQPILIPGSPEQQKLIR